MTSFVCRIGEEGWVAFRQREKEKWEGGRGVGGEGLAGGDDTRTLSSVPFPFLEYESRLMSWREEEAAASGLKLFFPLKRFRRHLVFQILFFFVKKVCKFHF